jgi:hypothetical protein
VIGAPVLFSACGHVRLPKRPLAPLAAPQLGVIDLPLSNLLVTTTRPLRTMWSGVLVLDVPRTTTPSLGSFVLVRFFSSVLFGWGWVRDYVSCKGSVLPLHRFARVLF